MNTIFVVLPYLNIDAPFRIGGTIFRSNEDINDLATENIEHITHISSSLYLNDNTPIDKFSYSHLDLSNDPTESQQQIAQLRSAHTLLAFLFTRDQYDNFEDMSVLVFAPTEVIEDIHATTMSLVPGYAVTINWLHYGEIPRGTTIYPPLMYPHIFVPSGTVSVERIYHQLGQTELLGLEAFISGKVLHRSEEQERFNTIIRSMNWYNKSFSQLSSFQERLVYLAVAYEILFHKEKSTSIKDEIKTHLYGLFGDVPKLSRWVDQFYDERSNVLHEGTARQLHYVTSHRRETDEQLIMNSLVSYGQRLFRMCIFSMLHAMLLAEEYSLNAWFIHDEERLQKMCELLDDQSQTPIERLSSVVNSVYDLQEYWAYPFNQLQFDYKTVYAAGKRLIHTYLESNPEVEEELKKKLESIASQKVNDSNINTVIASYKELEATLSRDLASYKSKYSPRQPIQTVAQFAKYAGNVPLKK